MLQKIQLQNQISQKQKLTKILSPQILLSLKVLQFSDYELQLFIEQQLEKNYFFDFQDFEKLLQNMKTSYHHFAKSIGNTQDIEIVEKLSPYQILCLQIYEACFSQKQKKIAENIIGNLDEKGFFQESFAFIAEKTQATTFEVKRVWQKIKTFHPLGIASRSLQEYLLLQSKKNPLLQEIIKTSYDDLLKSNFSRICKKHKITKKILYKQLDLLSTYSLSPLSSLETSIPSLLYPDVIIEKKANSWHIRIPSEDLSLLPINTSYVKHMLQNINREEKKILHQHYHSAIWLKKSLHHRSLLLRSITTYILKKQKAFFEKNGVLSPLTLKDVATDLDVSISTVCRAISNKYVSTPKGIVSFRYFFSAKSKNTEIAQTSAIEILEKILQKENKEKPLPDHKLVKEMQQKGILCARRTIAKYRRLRNIGNAKQRQKF